MIKKVAIGVAILVAVYILFKIYLKQQKKALSVGINNFINPGGGTRILETYQVGYLKAWLAALKNGSTYFSFNGKKYSCKTGRSITSTVLVGDITESGVIKDANTFGI